MFTGGQPIWILRSPWPFARGRQGKAGVQGWMSGAVFFACEASSGGVWVKNGRVPLVWRGFMAHLLGTPGYFTKRPPMSPMFGGLTGTCAEDDALGDDGQTGAERLRG